MFKKIILMLFLSSSLFASEMHVTLNVPGMSCQGCAIKLKKLLSNVDGVKVVNTNSDTQEINIDYESSLINPKSLMDKIASVGYESTIQD